MNTTRYINFFYFKQTLFIPCTEKVQNKVVKTLLRYFQLSVHNDWNTPHVPPWTTVLVVLRQTATVKTCVRLSLQQPCRSDCSAGGVSSLRSYISCICSSSSWSSNSLYTGFSCVTCSPGSARGSTFRSSICNSSLEQSLFQYPEPIVNCFDSLHEGIVYEKSCLVFPLLSHLELWFIVLFIDCSFHFDRSTVLKPT